jgi:hypothetical protein
VDIINNTFHHQFLVGSNTLATQDALGEVSFNKGINLFNNTPLRDSLKFGEPYAHLCRQPAQLTAVSLVADEAGIGMAGQHELDNCLAMLYHPRRVSVYYHSRRYEGNAGSE